MKSVLYIALFLISSAAAFTQTTDPDEKINSRFDHPTEFVGLGKILATRFAMPPQLIVSTETAELTEDDRDLLEALGYVHD